MSKGMLGMLPLSAVRGPKDDLDNLLASNDGETVLAELKKFVKKQPCWLKPATIKPRKFPVWKTIKLGTCKNSIEYQEALTEKQVRVDVRGIRLLENTRCAQQETELDLVMLEAEEFGFRMQNTWTAATRMGLQLCPPEVGLALRLSWPKGFECFEVRIAMEPIEIRADINISAIYHLGRCLISGGFTPICDYLSGVSGDPQVVCEMHTQFIFVQPRQ